MTDKESGFFIERLTVSGTGLPSAEIELIDGLNVISGPSDTGKSYLCSLIDYIFGASKAPRPIKAAEGYERVEISLVERETDIRYEVSRSLSGGDVLIRTVPQQGEISEKRKASVRHSAGDNSTLSAFLLTLSGFEPQVVRKNKKGETRTLSFRDVAFLSVVDENRIIEERSPHLSGSHTEATVESDVFRLMVTGLESGTPTISPKKGSTPAAKAQSELVQQLLQGIREEMASYGIRPEDVDDQLERIDQARAMLLRSYDATRIELVTMETELASRGQALRDSESRLTVLNGLTARFALLDRHYTSDIARLRAIGETGSLLESFPATSCPVCGASPVEQRQDEVATHCGLLALQSAAKAELNKTELLRADLGNVMSELAQEIDTQHQERRETRRAVLELQRVIAEESRPRSRLTAENMRSQDERRDAALRVRLLADQADDLSRRAGLLASMVSAKTSASVATSDPKASEMESFTKHVEEILTAWNYPGRGRVVFAEKGQDLVIAGQDRISHGKGVRAVTCAAYLCALLRHCLSGELPHPGLLVLDSPLVVYKDPDKSGADEAELQRAGVKDAFYRSLANGLCLGQIIVLENEDPPEDIDEKRRQHFTKNVSGRYGFFPVRKT